MHRKFSKSRRTQPTSVKLPWELKGRLIEISDRERKTQSDIILEGLRAVVQFYEEKAK